MAALIYQGRRLISAAVNILKSHPDHLVYYPEWVCSIHAEHSAIIKARSSIKGGTVYVGRHEGVNSKPCEGCTNVMRDYGIKDVVYMKNGVVYRMEI